MRTYTVEVRCIRLEDADELLLVQDQQVIETLPAHAPQKAFAVCVGTRSAERCSQKLDPSSLRHPVKEHTKLAVVVMDQESGCLSIGRCFPELLRNPSIGGMTSHSDMQDFSTLQFNDEEGKQRAEEEIG